MNIQTLYLVFSWILIIAIALSLLSSIGILCTGKIIERERKNKISSLETKINRIKPRELSEWQKDKLKNSLVVGKGQSVMFVTRLGDDESADYAKQFEDIFRSVGWDVHPMNRTFLDNFSGFITAAISNDGDLKERLNVVKDAFLGAKIDFRFTEIRKGSFSVPSLSNTIYVIIGRKNNNF